MVVYQVRYLLGQLRQDRKQKKTEQLGYVRDSKKNWEDQKNFYDQWLTLILIIQWVDVQNVTNGIRIKFRILLVDDCLLVLSAAWCNYSKSASSLYQSLSQFISPTCPKAKFRNFLPWCSKYHMTPGFRQVVWREDCPIVINDYT